jgi:phenylpropionate dioxygenase-like ring-hydroxylating dioxygenase large terminal subunit
MPIKQYVSKEQFEQERQRIFRRVWLNVGRVEEVPREGDYFVKDLPVCNASILVSRGREGAVQGFHNVCKHRGNKLVWDERGSSLSHACKFHGWTYTPDGQLIGVPEEDMFFHFEKQKCGLTPVATEVWEGFIFINLAPQPQETLREYLGEVVDLLKGYPFSKLTTCYAYTLDLKANWRILRDSQLEGYHAKFLHRRSLPGFLVNKDDSSRHLLDVKLFTRHSMLSLYGNPDRKPTPTQMVAHRFGTSVDNRFGAAVDVDRLPVGLNPTRSANWAFDLYFIFPNFHVLPMSDMLITHNMWPVAADRGLWEARIYLPAAENGAEWFSREYAKCAIRDTWLEDGSTIENTQWGLTSGVITHQFLQDQELAIRHAEKVVNDYLTGAY